MLSLVFSNRHKMSVIKNNVGGHQYGVSEQASIDIGKAFCFILKRVRIGQHGKWRDAVKVPGQFAHFRNPRLTIEAVLFGIKSEGQPGGGYGLYIVNARFRVLDTGE